MEPRGNAVLYNGNFLPRHEPTAGDEQAHHEKQTRRRTGRRMHFSVVREHS